MSNKRPAADAVESNEQRKQKRRAETKSVPYDDSTEELPSLPAYQPDFEEAEKLVPKICGAIRSKINELKSGGFKDETIHLLTRRLNSLQYLDYPEAKRIGFLGDAGAGKSSTINCLLGQQVTTESDHGSGTHVVQEFIQAPKQQKEAYVGTVYFHSSKKIESLVCRHMEDVLENLTAEKSDLDDSQLSEMETRQETALEFFTSLLCDREGFENEDDALEYFEKATRIPKEEIAGSLTRKIMEYLRSLVKDGQELNFASDDLLNVTMPVRKLCRPGRSSASSLQLSPWPLIDRVQVKLKSRLLSSGIMLVDLPGVADKNLSRVENTKHYLKSCSTIIICHPIARAHTDRSLVESLRECDRRGKLENTIVVITKIDDIQLVKPSKGDDSIADWPERDKQEYQALESVFYKLKGEKEDLSDEEDDAPRETKSLKERKRLLKVQFAHAQAKLSQKQILVRNEKVELEIMKACRRFSKPGDSVSVPILFVSNTNYQQHLQGYKLDKPPRLEVAHCGIPSLRQRLFAFPANDKMATLELHCSESLPCALNALETRCCKSFVERKEEVNVMLMKPRNICATAIRKVLEDLEKAFDQILLSYIKDHEDQWLRRACEIGKKWEKNFKSNTFRAICRRNGVWQRKGRSAEPLQINWNQELLDIFEPLLGDQFSLFDGEVARTETTLASTLEGLIRDLTSDLRQNPVLVGLQLEPFFNTLRIRGNKIGIRTSNTLSQLTKDLKELKFCLFSAEDQGVMQLCMRDAYNECITFPKGTKNVTAKRGAIIRGKLESKLFTECGELAKTAFRAALDKWSDMAKERIQVVFAETHTDLQGLFEESKENDDEDRCFRNSLQKRIVEVREVVEGELAEHLKACIERASGN